MVHTVIACGLSWPTLPGVVDRDKRSFDGLSGQRLSGEMLGVYVSALCGEAMKRAARTHS